MKRFVYFESQEGGMGVFDVAVADDLSRLYGWLDDSCHDDDLALLAWMETAEIGEMFDHRLGNLVRLKDA